MTDARDEAGDLVVDEAWLAQVLAELCSEA
jgi:hypothetical protein